MRAPRPGVPPLWPPGPLAEELQDWSAAFAWIAAHPPLAWRADAGARALVSAADAWLTRP